VADDSSVELMRSLQAGEADAAARIHARYVARLAATTRPRIAPRLARRIDPQDVLQSAWGSFFVRARAGGYSVERAGDLWRLLSAIVRHKLLTNVERHHATRRSVDRESAPAGEVSSADLHPVDRQPDPFEAAALAETWAAIRKILAPDECLVFDLRLAEHSLEDIAGIVGRSERTIRRWLEEIKRRLSQTLGEQPTDPRAPTDPSDPPSRQV